MDSFPAPSTDAVWSEYHISAESTAASYGGIRGRQERAAAAAGSPHARTPHVTRGARGAWEGAVVGGGGSGGGGSRGGAGGGRRAAGSGSGSAGSHRDAAVDKRGARSQTARHNSAAGAITILVADKTRKSTPPGLGRRRRSPGLSQRPRPTITLKAISANA
ncbi:DEAD-box ATP-dependent RNA helicase 52B-like [Schistocerca americana]|uniref:DEAD-box ATP-dependent RNA helicase 52B-like n=1 Tax=Schistocerca americana TaxID=7009 RepID=UPI001F4FE06B|nr:DEAD-box ATP-dependent RNA helicase 52B-like [Schistocerca americana]